MARNTVGKKGSGFQSKVNKHHMDMSTLELCDMLCRNKRLISHMEWEARPNYSVVYTAQSPLSGPDGISIPGLSIRMNIRFGAIVDRCKYDFQVVLRRKGTETQLARLEVAPRDKRTHNEKRGAPIYGPHLHFLNDAWIMPIADNGLTCRNHREWFDAFCRMFGITLESEYPDPYAFELES